MFLHSVVALALCVSQDSGVPRVSIDDSIEARLRELIGAGEPAQAKESESLLALVDGWEAARWVPVILELLELVPAGEDVPFLSRSLELHLLTVLRRLQGRPEPLTVEARFLSEPPYVFPELPVVGVRLLHAEGETETFTLQIGGNYRSGRLARWDLQLFDADGEPHAGVDEWQSFMGGGMSYFQRVGPGFVWGVEVPDVWERLRLENEGQEIPEVEVRPVPLALGDYRRPAKLGRYTLRALYHDNETIADRASYEGLVVHRSDPLSFAWEPRRIRVRREDEARILDRIAALLEHDGVTVTRFHLPDYAGSDEDDAHPLARLFTQGWAAVPYLAVELERTESPEERAKLIAALYSLSGLESPLGFGRSSAVGSHSFFGGRVPPGSGVESTPMNSTARGRIRPQAQARFVQRWAAHRRFIEVERVD
ncbi:MAG: hypothetical protein AAGB93_16695 [Planctomycetota bacterium]